MDEYQWVSSALAGETRGCLTSACFDVLLPLLPCFEWEARASGGFSSLKLLFAILQHIHISSRSSLLDFCPLI
jgi:hypothetical protein